MAISAADAVYSRALRGFFQFTSTNAWRGRIFGPTARATARWQATTKVLAGVAPETPLRHCVEIRHESFVAPDFVELLREHEVGLVVADTVAWPLLVDVTADFVYCRLHGSEELYASGYEHEALEIWADRIAAWATGSRASGPRACETEAHARPRDVYVYFDNDIKVRAPFDAQALEVKVAERLQRRPV